MWKSYMIINYWDTDRAMVTVFFTPYTRSPSYLHCYSFEKEEEEKTHFHGILKQHLFQIGILLHHRLLF